MVGTVVTVTGGAPSAGGNASAGGTSVASTGGKQATGGSDSNGGGATTGGTRATGGVAAGGTATGGTEATGGVAAGGTATGGTATSGSKATGGAASGGTKATGGAATGGAARGGTTTSGTTGTPDCNNITNQPVITVASDGSGKYTTVQAALNSVSASNTTPTQIRISPGTYQEKLALKSPYVTLCGQAGKAATTTLTYNDTHETFDGSGGTLGTTGSASTNISAGNVAAENITFDNSAGVSAGQAVALLITGNHVQFRNCRFTGYQDTLYVKSGSQYFKSCYVAGSVDFIFGAATAIFEGCTVYNAASGVSATAPNTDQATAYGLVFLGGELTAAASVATGSVALGRNWGAYGAAAYIQTALGAHISPVGWVAMGSNTLNTARFSEYQTTGAGASAANLAKRASQSKQLTASEAAAYTIQNIFGSWTPTFSQ